jgi:hypothetical protein
MPSSAAVVPRLHGRDDHGARIVRAERHAEPAAARQRWLEPLGATDAYNAAASKAA